MKIKSLLLVFLILSSGLSCSRLMPNQDMFDPETLRKVFAAVKENEIGKKPLHEIEITDHEVYFATRTERYVYSRGYLRQAISKSLGESKPFQLTEVDSFDLDKALSTALEFAKKNSYLKNPEANRIVIHKQSVSRDDNLVSNVGKHRDAMRCEIYLADSDSQAQYTTNLQGAIVDVAETNAKPHLNFRDVNQMQKSLAEIKPLFGGKLSVLSLRIGIENFSFTALDPKNPNERNYYRMNSHEFLRAQEDDPNSVMKEAERIIKEAERRVRMPPTPDPVFFNVDEIDFSLIPKVMQKTLETVKMSGAKVGSITIEIPRSKKTAEIEWQVNAYGDRSEKETVTFDKQGNLKNAN